MEISELKQWFETNKETQLYHRYITNQHIEPLLETLKKKFVVEVLGASVLRKPIYGITLGSGPKRLLFWSQMHGNETTTTKALFD
ncbi:MAG: peptidase M14, partial [Flavobacteriaceae bacterium CG_4_9_14_3_um_filter_33_16]